MHVKLIESIKALDEIQVTAKSKITEMRKNPEPITVINAKEIRGRATSIENILTRSTGIKVRKSGGFGSTSRINIHGLEGKRVQILVDNNPINSPDGNFAIDETPIYLIERIEIYKGIIPARFGGDGIGGAINIVTREYENDYIDLSFQRGSYNTNHASWVLKKNFVKPGIQISTGGFFNYADNDYKYLYNSETLIRDHDKYSSFVSGTGLKFTKLWFDEIEIGCDIYFNNKKIQGMMEGQTLVIENANTRGSAILPEFSLEKENFFVKGLSLDNNFTYVLMEINFEDIYAETGYYSRNSNDKQNEIRNKLNLNYKISDKHSINLNHSFRKSDYKPSDPLASDYADIEVTGYPSSLTNSILGLTYEIKLFDNKLVNLTGVKLFNSHSSVSSSDLYTGITFQGEPYQNDTSNSAIGYSEAIRYKLVPWLDIKASYQHAIRLPNTTELFGDGYLVSSNPDLTYEQSENINFGIFIDTYSLFGLKRLQFESNVFYSNITDYIKVSYGNTGYNYENIGHIKIKGIDTELKLDITDNIFLHGNATYQNLKDKLEFRTDGNKNPTYNMKIPNIPWLFANFGIEYRKNDLFFKQSFFKIFWESSYTHEFFYNWEMTKINPKAIPASFTHDMGIELSLKEKKTNI